jgi:phosphate transport system substrate-binding protein
LEYVCSHYVVVALSTHCAYIQGGLTTAELNAIFNDKNASVKMTALNAKCADVDVLIAGPDDTSGTQSFFKDTVFTAGEKFRATYAASPDFDVVVKSVLSSGDYIGYVPLSYFNKNKATLFAAKIKNAKGAYVVPTAGSIGNGNYNPFARRVYMNVSTTSLPAVKDYIKYGLSAPGLKLVTSSGLVPLPAGIVAQMVKRLG